MSKPKPLPDEDMAVRSLLMRLYRSRISGETAYPARFVDPAKSCGAGGVAPGLEAKGWIERVGGPGEEHAGVNGWRITEMGVQKWAVISEPVTGHYGRCAWLNELYYFSGKAIQRIHLTPIAKRMFHRLAENGGVMPLPELEALSDPHPDTGRVDGLPTLMRGMYVVIVPAGAGMGDVEVRLSVVGRVVAIERGWLVNDEAKTDERTET